MSQQLPGRRYRGPLRAVIFDWAGTIIDFGSRAPVEAIMEAFRQSDLPISSQQARGPMGMSKRDHLRALFQLPDVQQRWQSLHGRLPDENDVENLYRRFLPLQRSVLTANAEMIRGCVETVNYCRARKILIGTSTGYTRELLDVLLPLAQQQGFVPDATVCADDVPAGRPAPWMCLENARRLAVFPMEAIVVVDDTEVGIESGRNAGMWTVGVAKSGNLIGLSESELDQLAASEREQRICAAKERLHVSGAHYVIDTVANLPTTLEVIERCMAEAALA